MSVEKHGFCGAVDEVRISRIARYDGDFIPARRFEADEHTLVLYHFDEGSGNVARDSSGNGHDGRIISGKWVQVDDQFERRGKTRRECGRE